MGVAPRYHGTLPLWRSLHVAHSDVHAANKGIASIDHYQFAVVSVVDLAGEGREMDRHERSHLDACLPHTLEEGRWHTPTTHVVVDKSHLYAFAGPVDERIGHETSQWVVFDDVGIDVDVVAGLANSVQESKEKVVAVGININLVVAERQCEALIDEQLDERLVGGRQREVALLGKLQHGSLGQMIETLLADEAFLACVLAEEDVEDDADDGHEREHKNPCHGLCGLAIVHQDGNHGANNEQYVDGQEYPVQVVHLFS